MSFSKHSCDRFIQLADCQHIIPQDDMDRWMKVQAEDTTVRLAECPRCTGAIRKTVRYNRVINRNLGLVETVKKRLRGEVRLWSNLF